MEDTNKLFVFEKKEVLLIFVFVVLIATTAFTLGVRVGKGLSLKDDGFTKKEVKSLELKSVDEENADEISQMKLDRESNSLNDTAGTSDSDVDPSLRLDDLDQKFKEVSEGAKEPTEAMDEAPVAVEKKEEPKRELAGKYTIQLASEKSRDAAVEFAEPFSAAGYDVIINSVEIPGKGTWFRVSIGAFNSSVEAKEYMQSENDLFQGKDYIIKQFR